MCKDIFSKLVLFEMSMMIFFNLVVVLNSFLQDMWNLKVFYLFQRDLLFHFSCKKGTSR